MSLYCKDGIPHWFISKWGEGRVCKEGNNLMVLIPPIRRHKYVFDDDIKNIAFKHNLIITGEGYV